VKKEGERAVQSLIAREKRSKRDSLYYSISVRKKGKKGREGSAYSPRRRGKEERSEKGKRGKREPAILEGGRAGPSSFKREY